MSLDVYVPSLPDDTSSLHLVFSADTADTAPNTTSTSDTADTLSVDMVDLIRDGLRPNIYHATVPRKFVHSLRARQLHVYTLYM